MFMQIAGTTMAAMSVTVKSNTLPKKYLVSSLQSKMTHSHPIAIYACPISSHSMGRFPWDSHRNDIPMDKSVDSSSNISWSLARRSGLTYKKQTKVCKHRCLCHIVCHMVSHPYFWLFLINRHVFGHAMYIIDHKTSVSSVTQCTLHMLGSFVICKQLCSHANFFLSLLLLMLLRIAFAPGLKSSWQAD